MTARRKPPTGNVVRLHLPGIRPPAAADTTDILAKFGLRGDGIPLDHPDAELLRNISLATDLDRQREDAFRNWNARPARRRGTRQEAGDVFQQIAAKCSALEEKVTRTRATTVEGARAKLRMVLRHSSYEDDPEADRPRGGTMMCLPLSAIRDALAVLGDI